MGQVERVWKYLSDQEAKKRSLLNRSSQHSVYSIHSPTHKRTNKDSSHNYAINLPFIGVMVSPHDSSYVLGSEKAPQIHGPRRFRPIPPH